MTTRHKYGIGWVIAGFVLSGVSKVVEFRGDIAPMAVTGVSGERLFYHTIALLVLLGALACFVRVGILSYRRITAIFAPRDAELVRVFADEPETDFDADAVLARYMARRPEQRSDREPEPPRPQPPRGGFGRKGV